MKDCLLYLLIDLWVQPEGVSGARWNYTSWCFRGEETFFPIDDEAETAFDDLKVLILSQMYVPGRSMRKGLLRGARVFGRSNEEQSVSLT